MTGYNVAVWSALILAEILAISAVLNIVWLRRWRQSKSGRGLQALTPFVAEIAAKAKAIKDIYRQVVDGSAADATALLANVSAQEQELEDLLQSRIPDLPSDQQTTDPLQSLWDDMRDGHAVLSTLTDALLGKAKLFHKLMEKMKAQEQLLEELTELSTTYQQDLKDLANKSQVQQSTQEVLNRLTENYQPLQRKIIDYHQIIKKF